MARTVDFIKKLKRAGWIKRLLKTNEVIDRVNPLLDIRVEENAQTPEIIYATTIIRLILRDYQPQIDALAARITALETIATDHESRITALEP